MTKKILFGLLSIMCFKLAHAEPFSDCPSKAFLIQDTRAKMYGVNLATGHYELLTNDLGTNSKLNAMGFNFHDNYMYAWSTQFKTIVRIGDDFQVEPLEVTGKPDKTFYVGDIHLQNNIHYFYRPGGSYGLYSVVLDEADENYLVMERIIDGGSLNLKIFDLAFHPTNGFAYSVDRNGNMHRINVDDGSSTSFGKIAENGTYGAVYFDVDGNLYISRNHDGFVFRITVEDENPTAEFFANGPKSGINDGARCAIAPVTVEELNIDFGDAPDSYGTTFSNNGARHEITSELFLGKSVDAEGDAFSSPLSDDTADANDDEDGVQFITGLSAGQFALIQVESSAGGLLNAWIDWDQDGEFDANEQVADDNTVNEGNNVIFFAVPDGAVSGETWARFRVSSSAGTQAMGGAGDGEVEDYLVSVTGAEGETSSFYPSKNGFVTLVYEDNWPIVGDYDLNDLSVYYNVETVKSDDQIIRTRIKGEIAAIGAAYHSGFAVRLPGITPAQIDEEGIVFVINDYLVEASPMEADREEAIFVISEDMLDAIQSGEECLYYRTERDCAMPISIEFDITIPFTNPMADSAVPAPPYDPFLFATPDAFRGDIFDEPPGRGLEIHLQGQTPTEAFNMDFLNLHDDASDVSAGKYFVTENGMPWAMAFQLEWIYPVEFIDVIWAYPAFRKFVETGGDENGDWFVMEKAFLDLLYIY